MIETNLNFQLIAELAMKLSDPDAVKAIADNPENVNPFSYFHGTSWNDLSLTNGYPSLVLFFATLKRYGLIEKGDLIAHNYVLKIKEAIESEGLFSLSLFGGVAGICFALKAASSEETRYQKMLHSLHRFLFDNIESAYFHPLRYNQKHFSPTSSALYDPIQGVSGIGRYALENLSLPRFVEIAENIAKALVALSKPLPYKDRDIPGWYLPPNDILNFRNQKTCPKGNFNLGLAHGVTGALAYLAIAWLRGIRVEGQKEAICKISEWIRSKSLNYNKTISWPYHVSLEEELEGKNAVISSLKDAWCYGVPGIARTLFLAAKALDSEDLKTFAIEAFCGIFRRTQQEWHLPGPALCHGISGLLLITYEMSKEAGCEALVPKIALLKDLLLKLYQPEAPWGFKDVEIGPQGTAYLLDKPGFLEGTVGIVLTLLSITETKSNWHLPLMIHE